MPDWKKIKAEYVRYGTSYRKLADKYGVPFSTLSRKAKKEKWTDLRIQSDDKVSTRIVEAVADQKVQEIDLFESISDLMLRQIQEGILDGTIDLSKKGVTKEISSALRDLKDVTGHKSELDLQEQKARIDKLRREAQADEESKDIRVVISTELEDYSN